MWFDLEMQIVDQRRESTLDIGHGLVSLDQDDNLKMYFVDETAFKSRKGKSVMLNYDFFILFLLLHEDAYVEATSLNPKVTNCRKLFGSFSSTYHYFFDYPLFYFSPSFFLFFLCN